MLWRLRIILLPNSFHLTFDHDSADHSGEFLKLEFQGGEPTLRVDLLKSIIRICEKYFDRCEFVICSNLTNVDDEIENLYSRKDLVISTSIDGPLNIMSANRTGDDEVSNTVLNNVHYLTDKFGIEKISALPTVTETIIDEPEVLIDYYRNLGFESIFLRPVNYMGFARKRHEEVIAEFNRWKIFYIKALSHIVKINRDQFFEEYYLGTLVRNIFADIDSGFVDFRSPSNFLCDYGVIDFDGKFYPSNEDEKTALSLAPIFCIFNFI